MSAKRAGLGRNLSALLQQADDAAPSDTQQALLHLPLAALKPGMYQPRGDMDEAALEALAASIQQQGILQPIVVRLCQSAAKDKPQYEIIAGERRWRASKLAKLTEVPVIVREVNDETAMALALIENLQREALNAMDEARAMHRLRDEFGLTHQAIADLLSKSRAAVSNSLRLLQLVPEVAVLLEQDKLDMGHARCLLGLSAPDQIEVANVIVLRDLSVRETEAFVARLKARGLSQQTVSQKIPKHAFHAELKQIGVYLGTKIRLKSSETGQGRLLIDFKNEQQLKQLLQQLTYHASHAEEMEDTVI